MKKTIWERKIPTILGILFITIGIAITSFLAQKGVIFIGQATPSETPQNVRITNITDNSFNVSYTTDGEVIGSVNYGLDKNPNQIALDDRDKGNILPHKLHSITLKNLNPFTGYFFSVTSGQNNYLNGANLFEAVTGIALPKSPDKKTTDGKVVMPDGSPPKEGIIYLTASNAQVLSSLVNSNGTYSFDLSSLRSQDLSSNFLNLETSKIKILAVGDSLSSNVMTSFQNSIPIIILSKDYDFTASGGSVATTSAATSNSFPSVQSQTTGNTPEIITPGEGQAVTDQKPLFKGSGIPDQSVKITIESSDKIDANVVVDKSGNWSYRPTTALSPGQHTISIVTKDAQGILRTITSSFIVFASGTEVSQPATPSGQTSSPSPLPSASPTPSPVPSATPVLITPSPSPIVLNPVFASPTPNTTKGGLPPTGNSLVSAGIIGVVITAIGTALFFLSHAVIF